MPTDIALQKANLEFIQTASKEKKLPGYWAATILAGKSDIIELKKSNSWKITVGIVGLAGLSGWIFWWRWMRRKKVLSDTESK